MKYWERYMISAFFLLALPHILYETIKYYNSKYDKFWEWFFLNFEYEWNYIANVGKES